MIPLQVNFGGFVPVSTVDWPGRAVCTVFLRGCPARCSYCHNPDLLAGVDRREVAEVVEMIAGSALVASAVVFTGGEPTMQGDALVALARESRRLGLEVGVHTNGAFPDVLARLIGERLADHVALDIKGRWERYPNLLGIDLTDRVKGSLALCAEAYADGCLPGFEVVATLFRGYEDEAAVISRAAGKAPFVLQQGVSGAVAPLTADELGTIAVRLGRPCRVRTREYGEEEYEADRSRRDARKRQE